MIDRFDSLRHDPVIGGNYQNDNICHFRAARAHGGKRRMAGCVDKGNYDPVLSGCLIGPNMLGNTPGFTGRNFFLS